VVDHGRESNLDEVEPTFDSRLKQYRMRSPSLDYSRILLAKKEKVL